MKKSGYLVLSLDFESMWGSIGSKNVDGFRNRTANESLVVTQLLTLLEKYKIHSTWATVGALAYESKEELLKTINYDINYKEWNLSLSDYISNTDKSYFLKDLVDKVGNSSSVEMASHTFTHAYFCSESVNEEIVNQELLKSKNILGQYGEVKTIIFPRNQINDKYIPLLKNNGITIYRGKIDRLFNNKYLEFINCYFPISRKTTYSTDMIKEDDSGITNIPASLFLRFYNRKFSFLEPIKLKRLKLAMRRSAKKGLVFHLWFHPHNLAGGGYIDKNLKILQKLFEYYKRLNEKYNYQSVNMKELNNLLKGGNI